jgi:hypothetical protein
VGSGVKNHLYIVFFDKTKLCSHVECEFCVEFDVSSRLQGSFFLLLWTYECVPLIFVACFAEFRYKTTNAHLVTVPQHMSLGKAAAGMPFFMSILLLAVMRLSCKIPRTL